MPLWALIRIALHGLSANKIRSGLTMLGVIIGVGSVIAMMAIGEGASQRVSAQYEDLGLSTLSLWPARRQTGGVRTEEVASLTADDLAAVRTDLPGVLGAAPELRGSAQFVHAGRNAAGTLIGTSAEYANVRGFRLSAGRFLTAEEDQQTRTVVVLGPGLAELLFEPGEDPIGANIRIKDVTFTVVGVLAAKADNGFIRVDMWGYVPFQTAQRRLMGHTPGASQKIAGLHVRFDVRPSEDIIAVMAANQARLERLLRDRAGLHPEDPPHYQIRNMTEHLRASQETARTFGLLLTVVAGISLLVGGIGIMNIMVVTVAERTREIGIRKAIGARPVDIRRQFLLESLTISTVGGLLGVAVGLGACELLPLLAEYWERFPKIPMVPTANAVAISFAFSSLVGVMFGWYPAGRAAKLDPIIALRYE